MVSYGFPMVSYVKSMVSYGFPIGIHGGPSNLRSAPPAAVEAPEISGSTDHAGVDRSLEDLGILWRSYGDIMDINIYI